MKYIKKINPIWVFGIIIISIIFSTATYAYLTDKDSEVNEITIGKNTTEIVEEFDPPNEIVPGTSFTKKVEVKNTDSVSCYIRVFCEFSDSTYADLFSLDLNKDDWTEKQSDGYYYYKKIVKPGETTEPLFTTVTYNGSSVLNKSFDIIINEESVQSDGYENYSDAFSALS